MQRLLLASTRASYRACPAKHERSAAQSSVLTAGLETDASACAPSSGISALKLSPLCHPEASACQTGMHSQGAAALEVPETQQGLGNLSGLPYQAPPVQWCTGRDTYTGNVAFARQHLFSPLGAYSGRQAYASAAQAATAPLQQLFVVRQASNERPALTGQRHARSPGRRAAIIARLASRYAQLIASL